jgi:hypothetical protein
VPSVPERSGNFSDLSKAIKDPLTQTPFPGNIIPASRITPQGAFFIPYIASPNVVQGTTSRLRTDASGQQ